MSNLSLQCVILNCYPTLAMFLNRHGIEQSPSYQMYNDVIARIDTVLRDFNILRTFYCNRSQSEFETEQPQYNSYITSLLALRANVQQNPFATILEAQQWLIENDRYQPCYSSLESLQQGTRSVEQMVSEAIDTTELYLK